MIYVNAHPRSLGAKALIETIAKDTPCRLGRGPGPLVVNWGRTGGEGTIVLNRSLLFDKYQALRVMQEHGVQVPHVSLRPHRGYIGRLFSHRSGRDLLRPSLRPDFWVEYIQCDKEFRVHVFKGRAVASALKVPGEGAHSWVRTGTGGWKFSYRIAVLERQSELGYAQHEAIKAVEALGYDFGAVDVGVQGSRPVVFEVNSAPALDPYPLSVYAGRIMGVTNAR